MRQSFYEYTSSTDPKIDKHLVYQAARLVVMVLGHCGIGRVLARCSSHIFRGEGSGVRLGDSSRLCSGPRLFATHSGTMQPVCS